MHGINTGRVNAAVAEDVRKTHDVLELPVVCPGEQVAEIVGKDLLRQHLRRVSKALEHLPDVGAVERPSRARHEHRAGRDGALLAVRAQLPRQRVGDQNGAELALVPDARLAGREALDRDRFQLADAQAERAKRLSP